MYSSSALSVISEYALLYKAIKMFKSTIRELLASDRTDGTKLCQLTNHHHKREDVVENDAKWRSKVFEATEIRRLHDSIDHRPSCRVNPVARSTSQQRILTGQ